MPVRRGEVASGDAGDGNGEFASTPVELVVPNIETVEAAIPHQMEGPECPRGTPAEPPRGRGRNSVKSNPVGLPKLHREDRGGDNEDVDRMFQSSS